MNSGDPQKRFICDLCDKKFALKASLTKHQHVHTGKRPYTCEFCHKSFTCRFTLTLHCRTHTGERPYKCAVCEKTFYQKSDLTRHYRIHTGEKPYKCEVCNKKFSRKSTLNRHTCSRGKKFWFCTKCDATFISYTILKYHELHSHGGLSHFSGVSENKPQSDQCGVTVGLPVSTSKELFVCKMCFKEYTLKFSRTKYVYVSHNNAKFLSCSICHEIFNDEETLMEHYGTHNEGGIYMCHLCKKGFKMESMFNLHRYVRNGLKQYVCEKCNKVFSLKAHLMRHFRIHTGEKQFCCDVCDKKFATKSSLLLHTEAHKKVKQFLCHVCPKQFSTKEYLESHLDSHTEFPTCIVCHALIENDFSKVNNVCDLCVNHVTSDYNHCAKNEETLPKFGETSRDTIYNTFSEITYSEPLTSHLSNFENSSPDL